MVTVDKLYITVNKADYKGNEMPPTLVYTLFSLLTPSFPHVHLWSSCVKSPPLMYSFLLQ